MRALPINQKKKNFNSMSLIARSVCLTNTHTHTHTHTHIHRAYEDGATAMRLNDARCGK